MNALPHNYIEQLPGLRWMSEGQAGLSGDLLWLRRRLDSHFRRWGEALGAGEQSVPACLPVEAMKKCGYFESFPHLATLANTVQGAKQALLSPAACYHFYLQLENCELSERVLRTATATCFRNEQQYEPLRRQWSFSMREIVCIGEADEVQAFLDTMRARVTEWCSAIELPMEWCHATDPFFNPAGNPKYMMQRLAPLKTEMVYDGDLALGSVNFHQDFFGETYGIKCNGRPAFSGCVAFGLERWLYAFVARFGPDRKSWPINGGSS